MIKLIVSDMDGTLFNEKQEISPLNRAAILQAQKQGVRFVIATGRSMNTIGPLVDEYDLNCGYILLNGAEMRDEDGKIISTINIPYPVMVKLTGVLKEMGYIPEYLTDKGARICDTVEGMELTMGYRMMCLNRTSELSIEEAINLAKQSIFMKALIRHDNIQQMMKQEVEIRKMIVFNPDPEVNRANRKILADMFPELTILSSYPENIEINAKLAQKGYGLEKFIENMDISKEETAIFGDGLNDLSMFELFPNSYAPTNADLCILEMAKEVIPSNVEDGVGKKIFEILYKNREELLNP